MKKMWCLEYWNINPLKKKKKGNPTIRSNMDEPRGHYAKWNKPDRLIQILHVESKMGKLIEAEQNGGCRGLGEMQMGR